MSVSVEPAAAAAPRKRGLLPPIDSRGYHVLLGAVAILVLGPLGGVAAAYMNFSLGFFVGGQVLAGILGSAVTAGYGSEGKQGANYIQTMAASVASLSGMAVLVQAMVWLGMPLPPLWQLSLFFGAAGMFGVGVGMLYTPMLVDRLQLEYPSGHAVANILRALTDRRLLRRSIAKLGGGTALGAGAGGLASVVPRIDAMHLSASTIGAGMIVGSRIGVASFVMAGVGLLLRPWLVADGWIGPRDPFRKIGFLVALAMILGAAVVDLAFTGVETVRRIRARAAAPAPQVAAWKQVRLGRLIIWVVFWGVALVVIATVFLHQPPFYVLLAIGLALVFIYINGICSGISDSNPISSAFVLSVLLMSALGLHDPRMGLVAASILLVACSVGVDMQQDRSTGWRLNTPRAIQFRYQVIGIVMGAVGCVFFASMFMHAYPVLAVDAFIHPEVAEVGWQSAMTFKMVGALRGLGSMPVRTLKALVLGLGIGISIQLARRLLLSRPAYRRIVVGSASGACLGWVVDSVLLASPYASSFGGFVEWTTALWFAIGGVLSSSLNAMTAPRRRAASATATADALPEDMSTTSLVGGGLIAGESLFALAAGIWGLLHAIGGR